MLFAFRWIVDGCVLDLVESLRSIGVPSECIERAGHLPVAIRGTECAKREARVRGDASSQFASALMLMLSFEDRAASIRIEGDAVSKPYLELTRRMLAEAGVAWSLREPWLYCRERGAIRCDRFDIEPDASSAGYFFALAAATRSKLIVRGIRADSVQADLALLDPLLREADAGRVPLAIYPSNSAGPAEADSLLARYGCAWNEVCALSVSG